MDETYLGATLPAWGLTVLAVVLIVLALGVLLRPIPRWVDPMANKHRHVPGRPCYPCIERLEHECGIRDALVAEGGWGRPAPGILTRDHALAEAERIQATPSEHLTDAHVDRLEALADMFDTLGYSEPESG